MTIRNLPLLGSLFLSGLLTLGACGSSSSSGTGGTSGALGGTSGSLGGTTGAVGGHAGGGPGTGGAGGHAAGVGGSIGTGGAGGASGNPSCPQTAIPSCLQPLVGCAPAGTCTQQRTGSAASGTFGLNACYSNGVKSIGTETIDIATQTGTFNVAVSKGGTLCYTETADATADSPVISIKNPAGTTVATFTASADGTGTMVTCTGGTPVVLPDGCEFSGVMDMTTGDCTDGVCQ